MELTQRAAFADLQTYLGLTLTELPNVDATALLLKGFNDIFLMFRDNGFSFDDTDTKLQAIQTEAEVYMGAYFYFMEHSPQVMSKDFETYENLMANDLSLGGVKIGEKGGSKIETMNWFLRMAILNNDLAHKKMNTLLVSGFKNEITTNYA